MGINNGTWQLISGFYLPDCPPNLPFHSLPTSCSSFSVPNSRCFFLAVTSSFILLSCSSSTRDASSLSVSVCLSLRALGLSGSCQGSRRAHWCRRHRWGRPGQPVCSALPRDGTLRSESRHTAATAEPARKQTHRRSLKRTFLNFKTPLLYVCTQLAPSSLEISLQSRSVIKKLV